MVTALWRVKDEGELARIAAAAEIADAALTEVYPMLADTSHDLARSFGVLDEKKGIAYRGVFLTEAGRKVAEESRVRHQTVEAFLRSLGVSAETARIDAEGIEHHVSAETLEAFRRAMTVSR